MEPPAPDAPGPKHLTVVPSILRVWFGVNAEVTRGFYAASGLSLMTLKYCVETVATFYAAGHWLTPWEFLTPLLNNRVDILTPAPGWVGWAMLAWTLPFVWIAFSMSVRRAANAGLSPWSGVLILVPLVNLATMLALAVIPARRRSIWDPPPVPHEEGITPLKPSSWQPWSPQALLAGLLVGCVIVGLFSFGFGGFAASVFLSTVIAAAALLLRNLLTRPSSKRGDQAAAPAPRPAAQGKSRALLAILTGVLVGLISIGLVVYALGDYGAALFFGGPILMGCVTGFVFNFQQRQPLGATMAVALLMLLASGGCLLLFALEGIICLLMAAPLFLPLVMLGAMLGKAIAGATHTSLSHTASMLLVLPLMAGLETVSAPEPVEHVVVSHVEIDAPPATVWRHVVEFPDLPEPEDWFFQAGIACPMRATIVGHGVGAIRYCEFTTGSFVEPITTWDAPNRLAFDVTSQPDPMRELSPYRHVHAPHLRDASLKSQRGEFRLVAIPGGRTRLEGRTWYTFEMHPQAYWIFWSDLSIHKIHDRVLVHIKQLSESADKNKPNPARTGIHNR